MSQTGLSSMKNITCLPQSSQQISNAGIYSQSCAHVFHLFTIMNQNPQAPLLTTCSLLFQLLPLSYSKVMEIKEIDWHNSLQFCYLVEDCKNMDLRLGTFSVLWLYLQTTTSERSTCFSTNIFSQPFPAQKSL